MGSAFAYSLCSSVLLALLYLVYKWLMAGENQHACNRVALLGMLGASVVMPSLLPAMRGFIAAPEVVSGDAVAEAGWVVGVVGMPQPEPASNWLRILVIVYAAGVGAGLLLTLWRVGRLWRIIAAGEKRPMEGFTLVLTSDTRVAPFSWIKYVVMPREDYEKWGDVVLMHETRHLHLRHWIDLLFAELVAVFQWYNPSGWLVREELKTVHEYQADMAVIDGGVEPRQYQMLLIKKAVGARFPSLANSLNHSKLKKRVTMMYQKKSSAGRRLRALALVPAAAAAVLIVNLPAVASMLERADKVAFDSPESKVSENAAMSQPSSEPREITAEELKSIDADNIASIDVDKTGDRMTVRLTDGEALAVSGSELEAAQRNASVTVVEAAADNDSGKTIVVVDKSGNARTEMSVKTNLEGLSDIDVNDIESVTVNKADNKIDVRLKNGETRTVETDGQIAGIDKVKVVSAGTIRKASAEAESSSFAQKEKSLADKREALDAKRTLVYTAVEQMPRYPGGEAEMMRFIGEHVIYPKEAMDADEEGRVVVKFVIDAEGKVTDPVVMRGVSPSLDAEALRVVGEMPRWEPGRANGEAVSTQYVLPVAFKLSKKTDAVEVNAHK